MSGEKVTHGQTDPEYLLLGQRLDGLEKGWDALSRMWESRSQALTQCLGFQEFQKDAKQAEAILSNQVGRGTRGWGHLSGQERICRLLACRSATGLRDQIVLFLDPL